jgi:hypothetical protein
MDPQYSAACQAKLSASTCVQGTCRRGVYNFWTIEPRTAADITF